MTVLLGSLIVLLLSGVGAVLLSRAPRAATIVGVFGSSLACVVALPTTFRALIHGGRQSDSFAWDSLHGPFVIGIDPLSAFFLLPVLALSCLATIYGFEYMRGHRQQEKLGGAWFFYCLFVAGMILVLLARTTVLFLIAWEVMSVAAFALVTFEHEKEDVRRAGWIYLIAAHIGVAALLAAFLTLGSQAGSFDFTAFVHLDTLTTSSANVIFILALIGFGTKAGLVPLHVWLPEAHPAAPSHVSALMSGVMIKMGIYGLLRFLSFLGEPAAWWGVCLVAMGLISGLVGISLAISQRDLKRALAYSSIENIGLIVFSLGIGLWGMSVRQPGIAALGLTASLLHVWNHTAMKGLLFLGAGSILHSTGTKDIERLGGLMKQLPWTSAAILFGSIAISALPPLNGFVSEWLMYLGLLKCGLTQTGLSGLASLLSVSLLAIIGTLAVITFGRIVGLVLLRPRVRSLHIKGLFPPRSKFQADSPDPVRRSVYEPLFVRLANRCVQLRVLQQGQTHLYLAYIVLTVVIALSWASAWEWGWGR